MSINEILAAIRATSSKLEKRAILAAHSDNTVLREFLRVTYDPRIKFYVTKMPKAKAVGTNHFGMRDIEALLDYIASRKLSGKAAKHALQCQMDQATADAQELLGYIIARDVNAGMAENSILEVWPGLFFIPPYQRCASLDEKVLARFGALPYFHVQTKSDGQFVYAIKRGMGKEKSVAMSRAGSIYPEWVANHITYGVPEGHVAMGEMLVVRDGKVMSRKDGNGVLNSVLSGDGSKFKDTDSIRFVAWDMVTVQEFHNGESVREYDERWAKLETTSLLRQKSTKVTSIKEANAIHNALVAAGEEGSVWKTGDMGWRDCQSGDKNMVKVKVVFDFDAEIIGAYVHKKNPDMLGGFTVASSDRIVQFDVGSGFSEQQRLDYWRVLKEDPEAFNGCIIAGEGNDIVTSKGKTTESVFLPIFVELRLDKKVADSRERMWEQFNAAKQGRRAAGI